MWPSNESRDVVAEMEPGAQEGGATFRTRPPKRGSAPCTRLLDGRSPTSVSSVAMREIKRRGVRSNGVAEDDVLTAAVLRCEAGSNVTEDLDFTVWTKVETRLDRTESFNVLHLVKLNRLHSHCSVHCEVRTETLCKRKICP